MEDLAERKTITYDMVDMLYLNSTNMGIAEAFTQKTPNPQFKPTCDSLFTNHHNSNLNFNSICITLLSYFQLCKVTRSSSNPDSYCGYANYWLNGKLRKENGKSDKDTSIFFEIFSGSSNKDSGSSECKRYTKSDLSCTYAKECAKIYKENILNCSNFEDEFCAKLKGFRDKLMQYLESLKICSDTQGIISSIDKTIAESSPQNPGEISSQATTISATSFGTAMGVSLLSLFLYKVTPIGSWLSPRIGNLKKKTLNIGYNEENESLFQYSESAESNYTNGDYNIAYNIVGNS